MIRGRLVGTMPQPVVQVRFNDDDTISDGTPVLNWLSSMPEHEWDPEHECWSITATGPQIVTAFEWAGVNVNTTWFCDPTVTLEDLVVPVGRVFGDDLWVKPRLLGVVATRKMLPSSARWDAAGHRFVLALSDVGDDLLPGVSISGPDIERIRQSRSGAVTTLDDEVTPDPDSVSNIQARLIGNAREPVIEIRFNRGAKTGTGISAQHWVKSMPDRRWNPSRRVWEVRGTGPGPEAMFARHGVNVDLSTFPDQVFGLDDLLTPLARVNPEDPTRMVVKPRLLGSEVIKGIIGATAIWDAKRHRVLAPIEDVIGPDGQVIDDIEVVPGNEEAIEEAAQASGARVQVLPGAATLAAAGSIAETGDAWAQVTAVTGDVPGWFGLDLYEYQRVGAVAAVAGMRVIADEPGLGKSTTLGTLIPTPTGWTTMGAIRVGDEVFARDGSVTKVTGLSPIHARDVYRLHLSDGQTIDASPDHEWLVAPSSMRQYAWPTVDGVIRTRSWLTGQSERMMHEARGIDPALALSVADIADMCLLGASVVRDHLVAANLPRLSGAGSDLLFPAQEALATLASRFLVMAEGDDPGERIMTTAQMADPSLHPSTTNEWMIRRSEAVRLPEAALPCQPQGAGVRLRRADSIPIEYLRASIEQREDLWAGLTGGLETFSTASSSMADDVIELARSLGRGFAHVERDGKHWVRMGPAAKGHLRVTRIEVLPAEPMRCLMVEHPEHVYLTNGFVPTHNTRQALAAHAIKGTQRLIITSPPVALTHWAREAQKSGVTRKEGAGEDRSRGPRPLASDTSMGHEDVNVVVLSAKSRKDVEFPERGVVVVSDSLLASRPALVEQIAEWNADGMAVDEVHRHKEQGSARSRAVTSLAVRVKGLRVAISGTPMLASPADLAPALMVTGQMRSVFGTAHSFFTEYATKNRWDKWQPRKRAMAQLGQVLREKVLIRRVKSEVLGLPPKVRHGLEVDVPLTQYREAHNEVADRIREWIEKFRPAHADHDRYCPECDDGWPSQVGIEKYAQERGLSLMSLLRMAAGLCKVPVAAEYAQEWVSSMPTSVADDGTTRYDRPLIIWTHHRDVSRAMTEAVGKLVQGTRVIIGGQSVDTNAQIVDDFQAGLVPVLVASITAAGVGVTLTRARDALFVETDWSVGIVQQAEDRCHRIGTTQTSTYTTMVAIGTQDEHIQRIQANKRDILSDVLVGEHDVTVIQDAEDATSASQLVVQLVTRLVTDEKRRATKKR